MNNLANRARLLSSYLQMVTLAIRRFRFQRDGFCLKFILLSPFLYVVGFRGILDTGIARIRAENRQELRAIMYGFFKTYFCYLHVLAERFQQDSFSTVVDVGANMGDFTMAMSGRSLRIIAIEPGTENFNRLRNNIEKNAIKNVIPVNIAAHDKYEQLMLAGNNSDRHVSSSDGEPVRAMRLDALLGRANVHEIDVLKIDVQGHEEYVLSGLQSLLEGGRVRLTIIELHPKRGVSRSSIIDRMNSVGCHLVHEDRYLFDQPQLYFLSHGATQSTKASEANASNPIFPPDLTTSDAPRMVQT